MDKETILIEAFKFNGHVQIRVWCNNENLEFKFLNNSVKATKAEQARLDKLEELKNDKTVIFAGSLMYP